ncbi:Non-canonical poly(A) RNA polymerase PAPD5 [Mycena venus]|uniref:polynucleotide adenylyltransferase n=1 Tax=Mycena venus TaxID=2733690 RepID=A0A8H7CW23_9AGAR|nr:Non-canonical poly(A) RNA polymerase PAPD5 [Mycena venus]
MCHSNDTALTPKSVSCFLPSPSRFILSLFRFWAIGCIFTAVIATSSTACLKGADMEHQANARTNTHGLPPKPVRDSEKRKRSPAPVAPEDRHILTPWLASMTQSTFMTTNQRLHEEIVAYVAYVQATPQETTARQALLDVIQKTLKRRFPDGEVKLFGSGATGLCLPTGDMDLVVMTKEEIVEKKRPLFQMSTILKAARLTWDVQVNFRAKVPILTFKSLPEYGSFSVDIGINNIDGPQAIAVVNEYLSKMPALRPLILIVKGFLSQRNLNSAAHSGLGSYAVICMCISFLQLNPSKRPQDYIDKPMETESLGALLADFMFYYGIEFPYATSYISVTEGKLLPKESAKWITNKAPDGLAIQCLINPENDVGKSAGRLEAIRSAFKEGYATILQLSMTDTSLLGPLVSLTESTLNHRAHIQHIVDSGRLQAAVSPPPRHPKHKPIPVPAQPKPAHKPAPHLTHTPPAHLPPRPSPSLRAPPVPTILPYGMAFGAGSVMGRNTRTHAYSPHDGGAINRKGSGFASGMHEEQLYMPPVAPHPHPEFDSEWPPRGRGGWGWGDQARSVEAAEAAEVRQ